MSNIVILNERNIDEYNLVDLLGKTREEILAKIQEDSSFNLVTLLWLDGSKQEATVAIPLANPLPTFPLPSISEELDHDHLARL